MGKYFKRKGFTLVELLVVIAIIAILFIVLISKVDFATAKAKEAGVQSDFRSFQVACETLFREGSDLTVDNLNKNLDSNLKVTGTTSRAKDPWGKEYTVNADTATDKLTVNSKGKDRKSGTSDDYVLSVTKTGSTTTGFSSKIDNASDGGTGGEATLPEGITVQSVSVNNPVLGGEITGDVVFSLSDSTTKTYNVSEVTITGYDKNSADLQTITITKGEYSATTTVKQTGVADDELPDGVTVVSVAVTNPELGSNITGEVIFSLSDSTNKIYDASEVTITGYDKDSTSEQIVTITKGEYSSTTTVKAESTITVLSISVTNPVAGSEITGDIIFNLSDSTSVTYNASEVTITGYDKESVTSQLITVTKGELSCNVTVVPQKHSEQTLSNDIGIGTDGKAVNLDLWRHCLIVDSQYGEVGTYCLNNTPDASDCGYIGNYTTGSIEGTVPYKINNIEVTNMHNTFIYGIHEYKRLLNAPVIPESVTNMDGTFRDCDTLKSAPIIPSSVTVMSNTFRGCNASSFVSSPDIPSGVTNMNYTFYRCNKIAKAPQIPGSVNSMISTFQDCTSLVTAPSIPIGVVTMRNTFNGCTSLVTAPSIPSSVNSLYYTFKDCTSLAVPPSVIPNSITDMQYAFYGCTKLNGVMTINTTSATYTNFLKNAATDASANLTIKGTDLTYLNSIKTNAGVSSNITVEVIS